MMISPNGIYLHLCMHACICVCVWLCAVKQRTCQLPGRQPNFCMYRLPERANVINQTRCPVRLPGIVTAGLLHTCSRCEWHVRMCTMIDTCHSNQSNQWYRCQTDRRWDLSLVIAVALVDTSHYIMTTGLISGPCVHCWKLVWITVLYA